MVRLAESRIDPVLEVTFVHGLFPCSYGEIAVSFLIFEALLKIARF
jgi:hypothetical protein